MLHVLMGWKSETVIALLVLTMDIVHDNLQMAFGDSKWYFKTNWFQHNYTSYLNGNQGQ